MPYSFCPARRLKAFQNTLAQLQLGEVERWQLARAAWTPVMHNDALTGGSQSKAAKDSLGPWLRYSPEGEHDMGASLSSGLSRQRA